MMASCWIRCFFGGGAGTALVNILVIIVCMGAWVGAFSFCWVVVVALAQLGLVGLQHEVMPVAIKFLEEVAASPATVAARSKL